MASPNGSVTLTFVADTRSFDRGVENVSTGADHVSKSVVETERGVKHLSESLEGVTTHGRATADVMDGLTASMGGGAGQALMMTRGIADLTDGLSVLNQKLSESTSKWAKLAQGVGIVGVALAGVTIAWQAGTWAGNKLNDVLGRTPSLADQAAAAIRQNTADVIAYAGALGYANAQQSALLQTKALTTIQFHEQGHVSGDDFLQGPVPLDPTGRLLNSTNGGDTYAADQAKKAADKAAKAAADAAAKAAKAAAAGAAKVAETAAKAAAEAAKQALLAKLSTFQSVVDKARDVAKSVADALKPAFDADFGKTNLLLGGPSGVLAGLQDQLEKTKRLAKDISALTKGGLNSGLISQLVAGGLDSLPAADQLLAGGKSSIGQANRLSSQINSTAAGIASAEALRQSQKPNTVTIKFDPTGATTDDLMKLLRKAIRVDSGGDVQLALGSKK